MDVFEGYVLPTLNRYLPPSITDQIDSYSQLANTYCQSMNMAYFQTYVLSPIQSLINSPPDLFSIFILLLVLFLSLKILDYARRVITFWVILVFRLVFWGTILGGAWYAYTVGWEKSFRDAAWVLGLAEGFIRQFLVERGNSSKGR